MALEFRSNAIYITGEAGLFFVGWGIPNDTFRFIKTIVSFYCSYPQLYKFTHIPFIVYKWDQLNLSVTTFRMFSYVLCKANVYYFYLQKNVKRIYHENKKT